MLEFAGQNMREGGAEHRSKDLQKSQRSVSLNLWLSSDLHMLERESQGKNC